MIKVVIVESTEDYDLVKIPPGYLKITDLDVFQIPYDKRKFQLKSWIKQSETCPLIIIATTYCLFSAIENIARSEEKSVSFELFKTKEQKESYKYFSPCVFPLEEYIANLSFVVAIGKPPKQTFFSKLSKEEFFIQAKHWRWFPVESNQDFVFKKYPHQQSSNFEKYLKLSPKGELYFSYLNSKEDIFLASYSSFENVHKATCNLDADYNQLFRGSRSR